MRAEAISDLLLSDRRAAGAALDSALMTLHGSGEAGELCALHRVAAAYWGDDAAQAAFHRTHAYIYALEAGDAQAEAALFDQLAAEGRI
jgi:hypothetical protein